MRKHIATFAAGLLLTVAGYAAPKKALIVDGQNNHAWKDTTPVLKKLLEETKLFTVDVATSPAKGADMSGFKPDFAAYDLVVLNYNGDSWAAPAKEAFEKYVKDGGGVVIYHAADNAFPEWKEFNEMIAVGGWGARKADFGSAIHYRDGKTVLDKPTTNCGHHAQRLPFQVTTRDAKNPIMKGLPATWMHVGDELYDTLCGPAKDFDLLATAHSDPANKGTDQNEPMLLTVRYGKGRVFHTAMGHDLVAMSCVGFITTFQRGAEWAATGKVTQKVPADFPGADKMSKRE
jgi:type 1 glutamine amidotransferase